jgi:hypothetical protein
MKIPWNQTGCKKYIRTNPQNYKGQITKDTILKMFIVLFIVLMKHISFVKHIGVLCNINLFIRLGFIIFRNMIQTNMQPRNAKSGST